MRDTSFRRVALFCPIFGKCLGLLNVTRVDSSRGMTHDDALYSLPYEFKPERFIKNGDVDKDVTDPRSIIFGFGRR